MHHYDDSFDPPAPCLSVRVIHPRQSNLTDTIRAQLDTGADITVVPQAVVNRLGLLRVGDALILGYNEVPDVLPLYQFDMDVDVELIRDVRAVAYRGDLLLLGRDVLNHLRVLLDGPSLTFDLTIPSL